MRAIALIVLALVTLCAWPLAAQRPTHGRLFKPEDLGILETPDREDWQQPDRIMDALLIGERSQVADLGAGGGWFTVRLARRVGKSGRVYAHDIQVQMIESMRGRVQNEGLGDIVKPRLGTSPSDPGLVGPLDAVLIVDTYPQLNESDRVPILKHVAAALAPTGRLGIVDFKRDGAGGPGPPLEERMDPNSIRHDADKAGLQFLREEALPYQYLLIFGRRTDPTIKPTARTR